MKKIIAIFVILTTLAPMCIMPVYATSPDGTIYDNTSTGAMVVRIQIRLRELGYLNFKPTGSYKSMTVEAAKAFQANYRDNGYEMMVDGKIGPQSIELLFKYDAIRVSLSGISIPSGPKKSSDTLAATGSLVPWSAVKATLVNGGSYTVTDCYTGIAFNLIYTGGENHAEMESASAQDTLNYKSICGSDYNYLKRAVVISIDGQNIAASIQCFPHGEDTVSDNDMAGHVCLFFEGSLSNVGQLPDVEHTENIYIAAGQ